MELRWKRCDRQGSGCDREPLQRLSGRCDTRKEWLRGSRLLQVVVATRLRAPVTKVHNYFPTSSLIVLALIPYWPLALAPRAPSRPTRLKAATSLNFFRELHRKAAGKLRWELCRLQTTPHHYLHPYLTDLTPGTAKQHPPTIPVRPKLGNKIKKSTSHVVEYTQRAKRWPI